ncbi:phosphatidylinositol synthase [Cylindrobasidium torrendii FP15055 ss-10]|uniref:CDP-diacylglycerol--inositol 3-phosphatidyltransferase n=1 Tax=Cylindrobasidium torrendii FP15055 ss-10 TaxID=1314674 RepID=A0A0D7B262_9AGAR|nr:phosphatidylinositol synthase [Cylindrobasidium torrendii FP15055 ss-10]
MARKNPKSPTRDPASLVDASGALDLANQTYDENVFLFPANIIGYCRIILAAVSLHYMSYHPKYCSITYVISCLLDAVDGPVARARGESSKFGAVLDMVTDRCTTSCLLCYLSSAYPSYAVAFQFLIALDFSSHYMHMYSSIITGSTSHKNVDSQVSRILSFYYNDRRALFIICAVNELFFVALYLAKWWSTPIGFLSGPEIPWPLADWSWASAVAVLSAPICFLKNIINIVQLWKASKILVGVDLNERKQARLAKQAKAQ